jgi:3-methyladenine DNA glycosylase AlkC
VAGELRDFFSAAVIRDIARDLKRAEPAFPERRFVAAAVDGLAPLSLTGRAAHIANAMRRFLPKDFADAAAVISRSLGPRHAGSDTFGMAPFKYLPYTMFVAAHGLAHFEESMRLQVELTQRFSAEFSIRAFLIHHPDATHARLVEWARHDDVHVRRLVSEGSRPRLPWAPRLRHFQQDPSPVLALLELLKDDPELYVRRSVANSLNDIAKDHPDLAVARGRRWLQGASPERRWIVHHALRFLVKQGHAGALGLVGAGQKPKIRLARVRLTPARVPLGSTVTCTASLTSASRTPQDLLIDYAVHYVKANGSTSAKVFKLKRVILAPKQTVTLEIRIRLADLTTRRHYAGRHAVDLRVNGIPLPLGAFRLVCP